MNNAGLIKYLIFPAIILIFFCGITGAMGNSPEYPDENLPDIYSNNTDNYPDGAEYNPEFTDITEDKLTDNNRDIIDSVSDPEYEQKESPEDIAREKKVKSAIKGSNTSINFFYSERCAACHKALPVVKDLAARYPDIPVYYYDTYNSPENRSLMFIFAEHYNTYYPAYPNVFAGDSVYLEGFTEINSNIEDIFIAYDTGRIPDTEYEARWQDRQEGNVSSDGDNFIVRSGSGTDKITLPLVIIGGLLDGINPCAISVLLILLASLSAAGSRRTILSAGISYTTAVFIFYTLAGAGILAITGFAGISFYFSLFAFAVALIAGILSIYEGVTGKQQNLIRVPDSAKGTLKKYFGKLGDVEDYEGNNGYEESKDAGQSEDNIESGDKNPDKRIIYTITTAFILGTFASMFELPCTGGIYVAVLSMISSTFSGSSGASGDFSTGIIYLIIYNLMFILPLVFIILLMASGLPAGKIEKIDTFRTEKRRAIRIISGIVMIVLAIYLGLGIGGVI